MENAVKANITLKPEVMQRADSYAKQNGLSRSALIALALNSYLDSVEAMPSIKRISSALSAAFDGVLSGEISESEAKARLADIQAAYKVLTEK